MVGGGVFANLRWNSPIARAYWFPRKISSASFSRVAMCVHTGSNAPISTAMTLIPTSSAAIA